MDTELQIDVNDGTKISLDLDDGQVVELQETGAGYDILIESEMVDEAEVSVKYEDTEWGLDTVKEVVDGLEEEVEGIPTSYQIQKEIEDRGWEEIDRDLEEFLEDLHKRDDLIHHRGWSTV
jgi:hypothetical protein